MERLVKLARKLLEAYKNKTRLDGEFLLAFEEVLNKIELRVWKIRSGKCSVELESGGLPGYFISDHHGNSVYLTTSMAEELLNILLKELHGEETTNLEPCSGCGIHMTENGEPCYECHNSGL